MTFCPSIQIKTILEERDSQHFLQLCISNHSGDKLKKLSVLVALDDKQATLNLDGDDSVLRRVARNSVAVCIAGPVCKSASVEYRLRVTFPEGVDELSLHASIESAQRILSHKTAKLECIEMCAKAPPLVLNSDSGIAEAGPSISGRVTQGLLAGDRDALDERCQIGFVENQCLVLPPNVHELAEIPCSCSNKENSTSFSCNCEYDDDVPLGSIIRVDCKSPNNGTAPPGFAWNTAFTSLQAGINAAVALADSTTEIWVAQGRYVGTFQINTGGKTLRIYGGFLGNAPCGQETLRNQRSSDPLLTVLDGNQSGRVLSVENDSNDTLLDGFRIANGSQNIGAGILHNTNDESLTLRNVSFDHNVATEMGGAIYVQNGVLHCCDCVFQYNTAQGDAAQQGGGAVYFLQNPFVLVDNQVRAIENRSRDGLVPASTFRKCNFRCNNASGSSGAGGAIYAQTACVEVSQCQFDRNVAQLAGGAIEIFGSGFGLIQDDIELLNVETRDSESNTETVNVSFTVKESSFDRNSATEANGGAIHLNSGAGVSLQRSKFNKNSTGRQGGAVWSHEESIATYITKCEFVENAAGVDSGENEGEIGGGAVYDDGSAQLRICHSLFECNWIAQNVGSAIVARSLSFQMYGSIVRKHERSALFSSGLSCCEISDCEFVENRSIVGQYGAGGGAIVRFDSFGGDNETNTLRVLRTKFSRNTSFATGGAVLLAESDGCFQDCTFTENAAFSGGAVHVVAEAFAIFLNCEFLRNEAKEVDLIGEDFDDIPILSSVALPRGEKETFSRNGLNGFQISGGAVLSDFGSVVIAVECDFKECTALSAGGAVEISGISSSGSTPTFVSIGSKFAKNSTQSQGGAIHMTNFGTLEIQDSLFECNTADEQGGAVWVDGPGECQFIRTSFLRNVAHGNESTDGAGAIYNCNSADIVAERCLFENNSADGDSGSGGALLIVGGENDFRNCIFRKNCCSRAGGAIEQIGGEVTCDETSFEENRTESAPGNGGAIHLNGAETEQILTACKFVKNFASKEGAAVWIGSHDLFSAENILAVENVSAGIGGGIGGAFLVQAEAVSAQTKFEHVTATLNSITTSFGGAIALRNNANVAVVNSILYGNSADENPDSNEIFVQEPSQLILQDSIVAPDSGIGSVDETRVLNDNPLFVDALRNHRLLECSPAIGAAQNSTVARDLDGFQRNSDDLGAYVSLESKPNALVQLVGFDENGKCVSKQPVLTDNDGLYLFESLPLGKYQVTLLSEPFRQECTEATQVIRDFSVDLDHLDMHYSSQKPLGPVQSVAI